MPRWTFLSSLFCFFFCAKQPLSCQAFVASSGPFSRGSSCTVRPTTASTISPTETTTTATTATTTTTTTTTALADSISVSLDTSAFFNNNNDDSDDDDNKNDKRDEQIAQLFAWIARAWAGDDRYDNLMLAIAVVFGDLDPNSAVGKVAFELHQQALRQPFPENQPCGSPDSTDDREMASLGAMGAGQWTGQFQTRPHALLDVSNFTSAQDWVQTLPRGCRRTLKRALDNPNITVTHHPIVGGQPAPHSSLACFRCVVAHQIRLIVAEQSTSSDDDDNDEKSLSQQSMLWDALAQGVSRYLGTTRMAGDIYEYRNADGKVVAVAHEVRKGSVIRGQWFYADDYASRNYVWFHSVYQLVERAIRNDINVVDLGPSGSDAFSQLKSRYGFVSVTDWTAVADYTGPFYYENGRPADGTNQPALYERRLQAQAQSRFRFF